MTTKTLGRFVLFTLIVSRVVPPARAGHVRPHPQRRGRAAELADLRRHLHEPALQPAHADHAGQRREARSEVGAAGSGVRRLAVEPARRRRHHVRHRAAERRDGGRREDRPRVLAVSLHAVRRSAASAAARTTAASRSSATRCTWARSTRIWSRSMRRTARPLWNIAVADVKLAYSITLAPLVVKDKVIVGVGGGEFGIRGFIAAYDAKTGKEAWRFNTIPGPGEPGHDTWSGDDWKYGGGSVWVTGSYDPELNLTYWGIGNPGPDWNPESASRRQPLLRLGRRARCRHRRAEVAFPVHAERRLRLRLGAGAGARRHQLEGRAGEGDDVGEPQRLLLRARSRDRQIPARQHRS